MIWLFENVENIYCTFFLKVKIAILEIGPMTELLLQKMNTKFLNKFIQICLSHPL